LAALPLAADDAGFTFADPFAAGLLFIGVAIFAAVGALSHQHERAFSASLIYLVLGCAAAVAIHLFDLSWFRPVDDASLIEHLTEIAVIIALFSAGLKLDRRSRGAPGARRRGCC
jgi:NhaP-type Na+/H+ or K+/H+ antiporter